MKLSIELKLVFIAILAASIVIGCYAMLLSLSPQLLPGLNKYQNPLSTQHRDTIGQDRLYIPRLKLNLSYASGGPEVLKNGAWHRYPERGDPAKGGNFILAGHRFRLGPTPAATVRTSPFYRLNQVRPDDRIYVDFHGVRYEYKVTKNYTVPPTQISIEAPTKTAKMTLYTCTLLGSADGREVLDAVLVTKNVSVNQEF